MPLRWTWVQSSHRTSFFFISLPPLLLFSFAYSPSSFFLVFSPLLLFSLPLTPLPFILFPFFLLFSPSSPNFSAHSEKVRYIEREKEREKRKREKKHSERASRKKKEKRKEKKGKGGKRKGRDSLSNLLFAFCFKTKFRNSFSLKY